MATAVLIRRNFPHVVTVINQDGALEPLSEVQPGTLNENDIKDILMGLKELHSSDITVLDIKVGRSEEGQLKITDPSTFGYGDTPPIHTRYNLPESKYIKFKSDIWCVGCFIFGKNIPKRFMKSQELLDGFIKNSPYIEILKHILVIEPEKRSLSFVNDSDTGCIIH